MLVPPLAHTPCQIGSVTRHTYSTFDVLPPTPDPSSHAAIDPVGVSFALTCHVIQNMKADRENGNSQHSTYTAQHIPTDGTGIKSMHPVP